MNPAVEAAPRPSAENVQVMYVKRLTLSDACTSKQIKLPRSAAETFMRPMSDRETTVQDFLDEDDRPWSFAVTRYNCQYALSKIGLFAQAHAMAPNDYLVFYTLNTDHELRIACRKMLPAILSHGLEIFNEHLESTTVSHAHCKKLNVTHHQHPQQQQQQHNLTMSSMTAREAQAHGFTTPVVPKRQNVLLQQVGLTVSPLLSEDILSADNTQLYPMNEVMQVMDKSCNETLRAGFATEMRSIYGENLPPGLLSHPVRGLISQQKKDFVTLKRSCHRNSQREHAHEQTDGFFSPLASKDMPLQQGVHRPCWSHDLRRGLEVKNSVRKCKPDPELTHTAALSRQGLQPAAHITLKKQSNIQADLDFPLLQECKVFMRHPSSPSINCRRTSSSHLRGHALPESIMPPHSATPIWFNEHVYMAPPCLISQPAEHLPKTLKRRSPPQKSSRKLSSAAGAWDAGGACLLTWNPEDSDNEDSDSSSTTEEFEGTAAAEVLTMMSTGNTPSQCVNLISPKRQVMRQSGQRLHPHDADSVNAGRVRRARCYLSNWCGPVEGGRGEGIKRVRVYKQITRVTDQQYLASDQQITGVTDQQNFASNEVETEFRMMTTNVKKLMVPSFLCRPAVQCCNSVDLRAVHGIPHEGHTPQLQLQQQQQQQHSFSYLEAVSSERPLSPMNFTFPSQQSVKALPPSPMMLLESLGRDLTDNIVVCKILTHTDLLRGEIMLTVTPVVSKIMWNRQHSASERHGQHLPLKDESGQCWSCSFIPKVTKRSRSVDMVTSRSRSVDSCLGSDACDKPQGAEGLCMLQGAGEYLSLKGASVGDMLRIGDGAIQQLAGSSSGHLPPEQCFSMRLLRQTDIALLADAIRQS
ncbi:hypothetical protein CEUSTIGMA_g2309.t1 [Chlamydomonas eustigma]|uniref:Uncharacterized protein n=1 Tax=Chlamydomonas eustigma TaxID=1157962 RepID=A0A250WVJ1_9CHLO|nr:hypothetical protein CEUSTIGMA_g2309.t1 [Chlamydomonas eustigma]|eukprot:GAX74863.1 hypothetical protein CEUSTIGMA_g2309.t1 [Chlamydomonas eustigma]